MRLSDFTWYAEFWAKAEVVRFIGGTPRSTQESWMRFLMSAGSWSELGFGFLRVDDKADGSAVGLVGLFDAHRDIGDFRGVREAGWALEPERFGKGYALEAMEALLGWADRVLVQAPIGCIIDDPNFSSAKIARALGFARIGSACLDGAPISIWHRP